MALHIDDPEVDELARQLAEPTGEPIEKAVLKALQDRLEREKEIARKIQRVREISEHFQSLPVLDPRTPEAPP